MPNDCQLDHDHQLISEMLPAGSWTVVPGGSAVSFRTRALMGVVPVSGVFERFSGQLHVDSTGGATGALTVESGSLDTGISERDENLCTEQYLSASEHPHITFTVVSLTPGLSEQLNLRGALQIRDTQIPLDFPMYAIAHDDHLHVEARAVVDHHGAGLGWARPCLLSRKVKVQVSLTLTRA